MLLDFNHLSNPEVQLALQDIREKMLNKNAALCGIALGFVYSTIVETLIALSAAEHHVESDIIYTAEFQTGLAKQGSMMKQQFYNFTHNTIDSFKTSLTNQSDTYQKLYGEGRTFQAGFGVGNYVGDVAGYVYVAKGATQSVIRLSLTSYKVGALIVTKGISAAASLKQTYTSTNKFFAHHTFQNPITLQFNARRLNCSFPIDSIKFKIPFAVTPKLTATEDLKLIHRDASYHTKRGIALKSKKSSNEQTALENSVPISTNTPNRIGVDPVTNNIVILHRTISGEFHGHVRLWEQLESFYHAILRKNLV